MPQRLTRQEFVDWAESQTARYERLNGEPIAMSPERVEHARIKARVWAALDRAIQRAGLDCEALPDGITVEIDDDTDYEPDAVVNCGPRLPSDAMAASNPVMVVEVLSPSTQSIDSNAKLADYFRVPSIHHYLIVQTRKREVIHYTRAGSDISARIMHLGPITLDPPGITIDLADIYPPPPDAPVPPESTP
ncbi:MAG: Uma2 family endonuclease [Acetobacteraceae bacterium]